MTFETQLFNLEAQEHNGVTYWNILVTYWKLFAAEGMPLPLYTLVMASNGTS